jgi:hypothetical protein
LAIEALSTMSYDRPSDSRSNRKGLPQDIESRK